MNNNLPFSTSPYITFDREKWSHLRADEPMTLSEHEVQLLKGINEEFSVDEVKKIYLPLARLISYYVEAAKTRQTVLMKFLEEKEEKIPFIIGICGSVSVGKSTTSRVLQALLSRRDEHKNVALITTDGFLYPNKILEDRNIMHRKGFPESYNGKALLEFVMDIKSGIDKVLVPQYSHLTYDILPDTYTTIEQPDILIIEGLNVLQSWYNFPNEKPRAFVSDFLDFSIYVDAEEPDLEEWYISRFMKFREGAFKDKNSYFHDYTKLSDAMAISTAKNIWYTINRENLIQNILPSKGRASLILHKGKNHIVDQVKLRK